MKGDFCHSYTALCINERQLRQEIAESCYNCGGHGQGHHTDPEQPGESLLVVPSKIVADRRRNAVDISPEQSAEQPLCISDDAQGSHAIRAPNSNGEDQHADLLRRAVDAAVQNGPQPPFRSDDPQNLRAVHGEPDDPDQLGYRIADSGSNGHPG